MKDLDNLKRVRFWSNGDLQTALNYLAENKDARGLMLDEINENETYDLYALNTIIKYSDSDLFDEYDSDVCEKFIYYFKDLFLN